MKAQTKTERKRSARRRHLIGPKGVAKQEVRKTKSIIKAGLTGRSIDKAKTKETIKRVGEYKAGAKKKGIKPRRKESAVGKAVRINRTKARGDYKAPVHGRSFKSRVRMKKDT